MLLVLMWVRLMLLMLMVGDHQVTISGIVVATVHTGGRSSGRCTCDAAHDLQPLGPIPFVHWSELVATAAHPIGSHCFQFHADVQTLLETTIWTPLALRLINMTAAVGNARVYLFVLDSALEEAFATLAGQ